MIIKKGKNYMKKEYKEYIEEIYNIDKNLINEKKKSTYLKFKELVLNYFGVSTPDELGDDEKKKFYKYIDSEWKRFKSKKEMGSIEGEENGQK